CRTTARSRLRRHAPALHRSRHRRHRRPATGGIAQKSTLDSAVVPPTRLGQHPHPTVYIVTCRFPQRSASLEAAIAVAVTSSATVEGTAGYPSACTTAE